MKFCSMLRGTHNLVKGESHKQTSIVNIFWDNSLYFGLSFFTSPYHFKKTVEPFYSSLPHPRRSLLPAFQDWNLKFSTQTFLPGFCIPKTQAHWRDHAWGYQCRSLEDRISFRIFKIERDIHFKQKEVRALIGVRGGKESRRTQRSIMAAKEGQKLREIIMNVLGSRHRGLNPSNHPVP